MPWTLLVTRDLVRDRRAVWSGVWPLLVASAAAIAFTLALVALGLYFFG